MIGFTGAAVPSEKRKRYWGFALPTKTVFRYGLVSIPVSLALAARSILDGVLGVHTPYLPSTLAVTIAALVGGRGPGVAATILSGLGIRYFFLEPRYSLAIASYQATAGLVLFVVTGFIVSLLVGHLRELLLFTTRGEAALRESEGALRKSEERFRLAQKAAGVGTFEWDIPSGVNTWTPELEELYGLPPGGFAGTQQTWEQLVYEEDRETAIHGVQMAMETGGFEGEWRVLLPDGTERWLFGRGWVFKDDSGKPLRLIGVNVDITERKKAEQALRESESRYSILAEALPAIVFITSADGKPEYINQRWQEYTGLSSPAPNVDRADIVHPDDYENTQKAWTNSIRSGSPYDVELRLKRHDGVYRWFHSRATPLLDEEGRIRKWFGVSTDIEREKQAEARLRSSQKLEALGRLAGGVAHDFNNLLTAISGFNAIVMQELTDKTLSAHLQEVQGAAERATELTRQLLAFSRQQVTLPKLLDLNGVVKNISNLLRRVIGEDIKLTTKLGDGVGKITADPIQMDQVIMNLAINARDAMPYGRRVDNRNGQCRDCRARSTDADRTGRSLRAFNGERHGCGNGRSDKEPIVRTALYDERTGKGYRLRALDCIRGCRAKRWFHRGRKQYREGRAFPNIFSALLVSRGN